MGTPWLTVVIPTYNGRSHLADALQSLCRQDCRDFSVVAVDDGSTDDTRAVLAEYSRRLPLRIVEREHRGNWLANTNLGMSLAEGRYLGWLHQDDLWEPSRVGRLKELGERFPSAPMLFHPSWYVDAGGNRCGIWRCPLGRRSVRLNGEFVRQRLIVQNFLAASAVIFRREAVEEIGLADEDLWYTGDWDYWLKLLRLGDPVYWPGPMASFRLHDRSQTNSRCDCVEELRRQYEITLDRHLQRLGNGLRAGTRIETLARFSVDANLFMMRCTAGLRDGAAHLLCRFVALGPVGWYIFLRDSRILERVAARIRVSGRRPRRGAALWP